MLSAAVNPHYCLYQYIYSPSESASEPDEKTLEPQLDPGVEVPPEIAEASKPSWLYRSSKSPPNRGKSPSASKKSLPSRREAESSENRQQSPSPVQPRIRVSKDCGSIFLGVLCGRHGVCVILRFLSTWDVVYLSYFI